MDELHDSERKLMNDIVRVVLSHHELSDQVANELNVSDDQLEALRGRLYSLQAA